MLLMCFPFFYFLYYYTIWKRNLEFFRGRETAKFAYGNFERDHVFMIVLIDLKQFSSPRAQRIIFFKVTLIFLLAKLSLVDYLVN